MNAGLQSSTCSPPCATAPGCRTCLAQRVAYMHEQTQYEARAGMGDERCNRPQIQLTAGAAH